jgi:hypothetical protein
MTRHRLSLLTVTLVLAACGSPAPPAQPPERKPTVFDPTTETLERAKAVQKTVDDQAAEQRKRIEQAER